MIFRLGSPSFEGKKPFYATFRQGIYLLLGVTVLHAMIDDAEGGPITLKTLAKTYIRRKKEHKETGGPPLGLRLWFVNLLITVGFINAETSGHPSPQQLTTFYTEERLEDYILENPEPGTLHGLGWKAMILLWHVNFG